MRKMIIIAIILRLLVSAFYFHPDIKTFHFQASFLKKGVFNIYPYLVENKDNLPLKEEFVYFPLAYFTLGIYQGIISPFLGDNFDNWLKEAGSNEIVRNPGIFLYLTILKLPYLFLDLLISWLIYKILGEKNGKKAALVWLFNPFTIILFYVFGNIDIIPTAITFGAFYLFKREKNFLGVVFLGLAAGFKLYPLLFIPFLLLKIKDRQKGILFAATPFLVFIFIILPFYSDAFLNSALLTGLSTRIFNPGFNIGFSESIIVGLSAIALLFLYAATFDKDIDLFDYWTALFVLIFAFSHFHIQWLTWVSPFLVVSTFKHPKTKWLVLVMALFSFLIPVLYEDRFMNIGLLRAYSTLYDTLPTPFSVLERLYDPYNLQSILHSLLASFVIAYVIIVFKNNRRTYE